MKNKLNKDWKIKLYNRYKDNPEAIGREVARELDIPWSSCWDMKQRMIDGQIDYNNSITKPKILLFDIETAPMLSHVWGLFDQRVSLNQIIEDWYMLSWAAKWLGESTIYSDNIKDHVIRFALDPEDDFAIILSLWKMLDEADIIIGHNLRKFDDKKFKARCLKWGLREPSAYRLVDTLTIAKQAFALSSNKLDYLATYLGLPNKVSHEGHTLWVKCMAGDPDAWVTMMEYNEYDVELLEEVYLKIRHWAKNHPNVAVYYNDYLKRCGTCGSTDITYTGNTVKTNLAEYKETICGCCSKISRDGTNLLSKEKRQVLSRNIVR